MLEECRHVPRYHLSAQLNEIGSLKNASPETPKQETQPYDIKNELV